MKAGAVIVDIAAESGGNCELTQAGQTVLHQGVKIVGPVNLPAQLAFHASEMYARNLYNFLKPALGKDAALAIDWQDEVFAQSCLTHAGAIKHEPTAQAGGGDMTGIVALYIFMLAAFTGYEVIARVPVILHTPLMSGSNFVHGIVLVGAMVALGNANTPLEKSIGFIGVLLAAGNAVGGYAVTERMLEMFKSSGARGSGRGGGAKGTH